MEIYILRNGETAGPYSEEQVHGFLKQGMVGSTDLAWVAGMEQWAELHRVLFPGGLAPAQIPPSQTEIAKRTPIPGTVFGKSEAGEAAKRAMESGAGRPREAAEPKTAGSMPLFTPAEKRGDKLAQPATEKQKAFLAFMGVRVEPQVSMEQAGELINQASADSANRERMTLWNVERLRLHPELFAEEIHTQKEQRPAKYLEVVQKNGGAYFQKVTKAHCQVLLNHLDVQHPGWEQRPEAVKDYFFAAIVEKFPKLVLPAGRGKFAYPQRAGGGGETSGVARKDAGKGASRGGAVKRDTPAKAVLRGAIHGGVLLVLLYGGEMGWSALKNSGTRQNAASSEASPSPTVVAGKTEPAGGMASAGAPPEPAQKSAPSKENDLGSLILDATKEAPRVASAPKQEKPPEAAPAPKKKRMAQPEMKPEEPAPMEEKVAPPPPVVKDPKSEATLLKSMTVEFAFGPATIEAGTVLKVISKEGPLLKLRYGPDTVTVQIDQTDYADREAGKPLKTAPKPAAAAETKPGAKGATPAPKPGGALF
jgi:hypothetical protein